MVKFGFCPPEETRSLSSSSNSPKQKTPPKKTKKIIRRKKTTEPDENLNDVPLTIPSGMVNYVRPQSDMLKIRTWEMPRKIFSSWFNTHFKT